VPRDPLLVDPLFLAHYIERTAAATVDMIALCRVVGKKRGASLLLAFIIDDSLA